MIITLIKDARRDGGDLHWSAVTKRRDELGKAAFASLQQRLFGSWGPARCTPRAWTPTKSTAIASGIRRQSSGNCAPRHPRSRAAQQRRDPARRSRPPRGVLSVTSALTMKHYAQQSSTPRRCGNAEAGRRQKSRSRPEIREEKRPASVRFVGPARGTPLAVRRSGSPVRQLHRGADRRGD